MNNSTIDVLERLQSVETEQHLKQAFEHYLYKGDINTYAYIAFLPEGGPKGINNHPQFWLDHYWNEGYLDIDPVISRARNALLPHQWSDIARNVNKREKLVLDEGSEVGIVSGATIPVPGPGRGSGMVFVSSDIASDRFDQMWNELKYELHMVALYFHSAFIELYRKENPAPIELTLRERECLLWTSRGKTAWEIATILGVAERTVVFHTQNAGRKLGCHSKYQAVVKAVLLELITP